jgi:hypothetical protein
MPAIQMLKRDQLGFQRMFKPHSAAHQIQTVESGEVEVQGVLTRRHQTIPSQYLWIT